MNTQYLHQPIKLEAKDNPANILKSRVGTAHPFHFQKIDQYNPASGSAWPTKLLSKNATQYTDECPKNPPAKVARPVRLQQ